MQEPEAVLQSFAVLPASSPGPANTVAMANVASDKAEDKNSFLMIK